MNLKKIALQFSTISLLTASGNAFAIDLSGTIFEKVAHNYNLDPVLLYSVALAESASGRGNGSISPWAWTLRDNESVLYSLSIKEARQALSEHIEKNGEGSSIDVGMMQVNLKWHGNKVSSPFDLLDIETNLEVGAGILNEAIKSSPDDIVRGIGRYNNWKDPERNRTYGTKVLSIYNQLKNSSAENNNKITSISSDY